MSSFKGFFTGVKNFVTSVAKTLWNIILGIIRGDLLARDSVEKFIPHFVVFIICLITTLIIRLGIERTFYRLEDTKEELVSAKILYIESLYEYEQSQSIGNVLGRLDEEGSKLDIPMNVPVHLDKYLEEIDTVASKKHKRRK